MIVMITGASRGIGLELVKFFSRIGNNTIYALSRNKAALNLLIGDCKRINRHSIIHPLVIDLEQLINEPGILLKELSLKDFQVDILINNAGLLINKPFRDIEPEDIGKMFNVNCLGPAMLIKLLIPYMGQKSTAHVVNISSMGGFQGSVKFPGLSWYSAGKAALACLTECLQEEFKNSNIAFNSLALGSVQTEMLQEAFPNYKADLKPEEMAEFIGNFAMTAHKFIKGKTVPVSSSTP